MTDDIASINSDQMINIWELWWKIFATITFIYFKEIIFPFIAEKIFSYFVYISVQTQNVQS